MSYGRTGAIDRKQGPIKRQQVEDDAWSTSKETDKQPMDSRGLSRGTCEQTGRKMDLSDGDQLLDVLSIRGTRDLFPQCRVENPSRERLFSIRSRRTELKELSPIVPPMVLLEQIKELP